MNTVLRFLRDLDRRLLLRHPQLWLLRFHHVHLWACLLLLVTVPIALLSPSLHEIPSPPRLMWQALLVSTVASIYWLFLQYRNVRSLPFHARVKWYPRALGFWYCLMVINAPAFVSSWLMYQRIVHLTDAETLAHDITLLNELEHCSRLWSEPGADCPELRTEYSDLLEKYEPTGYMAVLGLSDAIKNKELTLEVLQTLSESGTLKQISAQMELLKSYQSEQQTSYVANQAAATGSSIREAFRVLTLLTLSASIILFVGSAQWGTFMWFLAPVLFYMSSPLVFSGLTTINKSLGMMGLGFPALILVASCVHASRARRKSQWLAAAWGIINFTYPVIVFTTLPYVAALLLYSLTLPALQVRQDRLRALPD